MKLHQVSWDQMTWTGKSWDEAKQLRRHEMSWDVMGWHRLWWQWYAVSCDAIRWNERRFNIRRIWHQIDKSRAYCHEAQEACLSYHRQPLPRSISYVPFKFETSAPDCPGTTCSCQSCCLIVYVYVCSLFKMVANHLTSLFVSHVSLLYSSFIGSRYVRVTTV